MREAKHIAIPGAGGCDVLHGARDLPHGSDRKISLHVGLLSGEIAVAANTGPRPQVCPAVEAELCQHIGHVKLHGVGADAQAFGDVAIGEAVAHELHHAPFGEGEDIVIRWAAPCHGPCHSLTAREFPYPL